MFDPISYKKARDVEDKLSLKTSQIEKTLKDYQATLAGINPNQEAKQSVSDYGIVSLPKNSANGQASVGLKGLTVTNLVQNGNFANGTTGWTSGDSAYTLSSNNNELVATVNNLLDYADIRRSVNIVVSKKYYCVFWIKPQYSNATYVRLGGVTAPSVTPIAGMWNRISAIITPVDNSRLCCRHLTHTNYAKGDEVYFADVMVIELPDSFDGDLETCDKIFANWFDGTKSVQGACRVRGTESTLYLQGPELRSCPNGVRDEIRKSANGGYELVQRVAEDGTELLEPIITPIPSSGTLLSNPSGTVYIEPVLSVAGLYEDVGIPVTNSDYPIDTLERIYKIDFVTGIETELPASDAVVAENGLSFTHPELTKGDIVFFTYFYPAEYPHGELTVNYYDTRYTVKDSVTGKFYKWEISVANGTPSIDLVEV